ncbi:MAG: lipocalin family protein [Planctomycetia bacterium]|nr:lipocalin family protein [Planctomycetia bacterium]
MRFTTLALVLALLAGCGKGSSSSSSSSSSGSPSTNTSSPAWKPIPGGREHRFAGVAADIPPGWNVVPQGDATLVAPASANQGTIDEIYAFMGAPTVKDLDTPGLDQYLDNAVMQLLQVPARRNGDPRPVKIGALDGRLWSWTATLADGRRAEVRSWAFNGSYVGSFTAVATTEALQKRQPELDQILASFRRPAAAAITADRLCTTWVRAFGRTGGVSGNSNEQRITFHPNGRFEYHSEGTSYGIFHSGSSQTDLSGSWKLSGDQLTGNVDGGESKTFTLEARTEAGTGAAVIAIDGTEFRQVDGRPW